MTNVVDYIHTTIRSLGFYDGLSVAICIMIGTGIFASPGTALDNAGSPGASLVAWLLAGIIFHNQ